MPIQARSRRTIWLLALAIRLLAPGSSVQAETPEVQTPQAQTPQVQAAQQLAPTGQPPAEPAALAANGSAPQPPVLLNRPAVLDTAHLKGADTVVTLFGVKGWGGDPAHALQAFITANGDRVTCQPHPGGNYVCTMPTGLDVAATALANGAAQTLGEVPADYQAQEMAAQSAHLGIWGSLPPIPLALQHPVARTTAEIEGDGQIFPLRGVVGFPAAYDTMQLQRIIASHGDRLICAEQQHQYVCLLPDGADIARLALQNGLARVGADAPAEYRADQARAVASNSGFWFNPPQPVVAQMPPGPILPECCAVPPGSLAAPSDLAAPDPLGAGLSYDGGYPTAIIDGVPVFFGFNGLFGFGFFDVEHHFHAAPEPYRSQLERLPPAGAGLAGTRVPATSPSVAAFHAPAFYGPGGLPSPAVFNGPRAVAEPQPGLAAPTVFRPNVVAPPPGLATRQFYRPYPALGAPRATFGAAGPRAFAPRIAAPPVGGVTRSFGAGLGRR